MRIIKKIKYTHTKRKKEEGGRVGSVVSKKGRVGVITMILNI